MYEPTLDTPFNTYFTPGVNIPIPVPGIRADALQTYAVIPTEGYHADWFVPLPVGGLASAGKADMQQ